MLSQDERISPELVETLVKKGYSKIPIHAKSNVNKIIGDFVRLF